MFHVLNICEQCNAITQHCQCELLQEVSNTITNNSVHLKQSGMSTAEHVPLSSGFLTNTNVSPTKSAYGTRTNQMDLAQHVSIRRLKSDANDENTPNLERLAQPKTIYL